MPRSSHLPPSPHAKVQRHRERLRAQGLRPVQIWVPDTRTPSFKAEAERQARALASSAREHEDQAFIDSIADME